jgi:DNA-directed RNA polymerase specialized sigma24 family protein
MITVTVEHDGYNWVAVSACGGTTSAKRIDQLPDRVREIVELMTGDIVDVADISLDIRVPGAELASQARTAREAAERALEHASAMTGAAVDELRSRGYSLRDVAAMVGVSYQRVHQLTSNR